MGGNQVLDVLPGCGIKGIDAHIPFWIGISNKQTLGIGNAGAVDECQAYMVGHDAGLAYPGAHVTSAGGIEIGQSPAVKVQRRGRRHLGHDIMNFQNDVQAVGVEVAVMRFQIVNGQHFLNMLPQSGVFKPQGPSNSVRLLSYIIKLHQNIDQWVNQFKMDNLNFDDQANIDKLSESLTNELVGAVGLPKTRFTHWLFWNLFRGIMRRMAEIGVPFNRITRDEGLPAASRWVLKKWCHAPMSRGEENIPPEGPLFVISNHPGAYDALVLFSLLGRQDIHWISSEIPFLNLLPDVRQHILFANRRDTTQGMTVLRNIAAHLKRGGTIVYFGSGHRDPDPAVYAGSESSIDHWLPIVDPLYRVVPGLRVLPVMMSGMVSEKWANHPLTWLRRVQIDKHRLAEFGQVITQLVRPGKFFITPAISFGKSYSESEIRALDPNATPQVAIVRLGRELLAQHRQDFSLKYA